MGQSRVKTKKKRRKFVGIGSGNQFGQKKIYTIKECVEDLKKYKNFSNWKKKSYKICHFTEKNNITDECLKLAGIKKKKNSYTYKQCKEESLKYQTRSDWIRGSNSTYNKSVSMGWHNELTKHMKSTSQVISELNTKWTLDKCKKIASKYKTKSQWQKGHIHSYNAASKSGWLEICGNHMVSAFKWLNKEQCLADAKKYKRKGEWNKKSGGSYRSALNNGWIEECSAHMKQFKTKEDCIEDAKKYKTKQEWWEKSPGFYWSAYSRGWFKDCTKHMPEHSIQKLKEKRDLEELIEKIKLSKLCSEIHREVMLDKKSFPDLTLTISDKIVIVEIKYDGNRWHSHEIRDQILKYEKAAIKKYKDRLHSVILSSKKGKYGLSFDELMIKLSEIKNKN